METKNNPGPNSCYAKALPDEPMFILLGRDPDAPTTIRAWAGIREQRLIDEDKDGSEDEQIDAAVADAEAFEKWRADNDGKWRDAKPTPIEHPSEEMTSLAGRVLAADLDNLNKTEIEELVTTAKSLAASVLRLDPKAGQGGD